MTKKKRKTLKNSSGIIPKSQMIDLSCSETFKLAEISEPNKNLYQEFFKQEDIIILKESQENLLPSDKSMQKSLCETISQTILKHRDYSENELNAKYSMDLCLIEREDLLYKVRNKDYIKDQPHIRSLMRTILLDWIMNVCEQFYFGRQTFHRSVVLFDIFMSKSKEICTSKLQLIGAVCLLIASKYEVRKKPL